MGATTGSECRFSSRRAIAAAVCQDQETLGHVPNSDLLCPGQCMDAAHPDGSHMFLKETQVSLCKIILVSSSQG